MKNDSGKNMSRRGVSVGRRGFSLVEILMAMLIFSMASVMVMGAYFDVFQSRVRTRAIQQDIEDARYAMESMAKSLRTSTVFTPDGSSNTISVYDYSQGTCIKYALNSGLLEATTGTPVCKKNTDGTVWVSGCNSFSGTSQPMTTANVDELNFNVEQSSFSTSGPSKRLGHVTIGLQVCYGGDCATDSATIQTSVSLRDYSYIKGGSDSTGSSGSPCPSMP